MQAMSFWWMPPATGRSAARRLAALSPWVVASPALRAPSSNGACTSVVEWDNSRIGAVLHSLYHACDVPCGFPSSEARFSAFVALRSI